MSADDDLERILREGWKRLPEPDGGVTRRARERVVGVAPQRHRRRVRIAALAATALAVAVATGVSIGSLIAQDVTASEGPVGLGFVPAPGWFALQASSRFPSDRPAVAMAANVPFAEDDVVNGLAEPSSLPYSTLLTLPPRGIVIVATFIAAEGQPWTSIRYPKRTLPLRIWQSTPYIEYGTQVRPEQPLGQYQLRAVVKGWNVEVNAYFGTPRPSPTLISEAQRGLDNMIVRTARVDDSPSILPLARVTTSSPGIVDRTFSCNPSLVGGVHKLDVLASRGSGRRGVTWARPAFAGLRTNISGSAATRVDNYLVWLTAGRPSRDALVPQPGRIALFDFPFRVWGTLAINRTRCRLSKARVTLSSRGLVGGQAGVFADELACTTPRAVLVRVRAVTEGRTTLRSFRSFVRTQVPVIEAVIAVQAPGGKPLALARLSRFGTARIDVAQPPCYPN